MRSGTEAMERAAGRAEQMVRGRRGQAALHWLALGSIGASLALFIAGKKNLAILVGLWPPTLEALRGR